MGDRGFVAMLAVGGSTIALMVLLVASGLRRTAPESFTPTPLQPRPADGRLVGPTLVTVDATQPDQWRFFSLETGTVVRSPDPLGWDIAFRRFQVIANGGDGFAGTGGIADLGEVALNAVKAVPGRGYVANTVGSDTVNAAVQEWYDYSYFSHLLSPKPRVYAIRTATGRFAKLQFVGYYCPEAVPGCVTFRYVYQGAGGVNMLPSRTQEAL
jgi:HmuY protein